MIFQKLEVKFVGVRDAEKTMIKVNQQIDDVIFLFEHDLNMIAPGLIFERRQEI